MIEGINQVQAKPDIGLEFATGLRAFVRQDPDIILVGEIRDKETAEVAINAALTGHLVFATLHTNDAVGAITRLQNMGVEPFLIASTVILSVAQRLMRKICKNCKEEYKPSLSLLNSLDLDKEKTYWHGKGCNFCNNTGYRGRIGIFELLPISKNIADMIMEREPALRIKEVAVEEGMSTLREAAKKKVYNGISTIEELARLTLE
jgi:type II secretory ATPase GspE/PulE/Tfp pilus assembly ATPase PilB-like protein